MSDVEDVEESVECVLCKTVIEKLDQLLEGKTAVVSQSNLLKPFLFQMCENACYNAGTEQKQT